MILTIKLIIIKLIITIIIKYRDRYRTPTSTNTELFVTLHNGLKPLNNVKKSSPSNGTRVLYTPLKLLIHHVT